VNITQNHLKSIKIPHFYPLCWSLLVAMITELRDLFDQHCADVAASMIQVSALCPGWLESTSALR